jgi:Cu/Ag efflux pump CusA
VNLFSLGAIDFGIIVDSSIVMVEGIFRHLSLKNLKNREKEFFKEFRCKASFERWFSSEEYRPSHHRKRV